MIMIRLFVGLSWSPPTVFVKTTTYILGGNQFKNANEKKNMCSSAAELDWLGSVEYQGISALV